MFELAPGEFVAARQLLDTAPDAMVVVGSNSRIVYVNRQAVTLFGYSSEELIGQSLDVLIPARYHATHGSHVARFFAAPTVRSMGSGIELFGARKDGVELPIEVSLSPLESVSGTFVSAAIRDVTERKRTQAAVRLMSDRLTSAVDSIPESLALFDADDRLFLCNSSYRMLFGETFTGPIAGLRYAEVLDAAMQVIVFESDAAREEYRAARLAERERPGPPYELRTTTGRCLRVTNRRTAEGGIVQTVADITDDMERAEELRRARIAAEAGSAAKSDFLASMSHELRTPLNAVLGFAQLSQRDKKEPLSPRHQRRMEQILKGGEHLLRLIDDILDLARIEAGGITMSNEPVAAIEVVREVVATLEPAATRVGLRLVVREDEGVHASSVVADRTRLAQILMNYGSNAIKYNRADGVVTFGLAPSGAGMLRLSVLDTGMGVPADKRHTLFQPFQRAGQETGSIEGTGIGLAISKRLAELMGGAVGYCSVVEGGGSEFWVDLPVFRGEAAYRSLPLEAHGDALLGATTGCVLYVEDNPANVVFMRDLLEAFPHIELLVAPTAEDGLELAQARHPHVIILDINLPGMSGLDALRALRLQPDTRDIPVIALTAAASERDRERGERAGFYRYLTKPVRIDELERVLQDLLHPD